MFGTISVTPFVVFVVFVVVVVLVVADVVIVVVVVVVVFFLGCWSKRQCFNTSGPTLAVWSRYEFRRSQLRAHRMPMPITRSMLFVSKSQYTSQYTYARIHIQPTSPTHTPTHLYTHTHTHTHTRFTGPVHSTGSPAQRPG